MCEEGQAGGSIYESEGNVRQSEDDGSTARILISMEDEYKGRNEEGN